MRILRDEIFRPGVEIGKITPAPAGNADFLARRLGMVHDQNAPARMGCAHHTGGTCANDCCIHFHACALPGSAAVVKLT
jgi:hypothetical protein